MTATTKPAIHVAARKLWLTCTLLACTAGLALAAALTGGKTTKGDRAARAIPTELPTDRPVWFGTDRPLDKRILDILGTTDVLNRVYTRNDSPTAVYLTIVYSERNRKGVHPPKVCLQGVGELALKETEATLPGLGPNGGPLEALEMETQFGTQKTYHLYFYKCGHVYTPSFLRQQFTIWLNGLTDRDASGALIRLSAIVPPGREEETRHRVQSLLALMMPHIREKL